MPIDTLTIGIRFFTYVSLMLLFGGSLFTLRTIASPAPARAIGTLAMLAIALSSAGITVMTASMSGAAITAVTRADVAVMIRETPMGMAWQVRMAMLVVIVVLAIAADKIGRARVLAAVTLAAGVALASLAWTGHGAAGEGNAGRVQLGADIVHLLAAGTWFGALVGLAGLVRHAARMATAAELAIAHRALAGFAVSGTIITALLLATGLVSGWMLVGRGHVFDLTATAYGRLLVAKLALFTAMLGLAARNRFRLTPALAQRGSADVLSALRRSLFLETAALFVILALVAWLGTLEPPMVR